MSYARTYRPSAAPFARLIPVAGGLAFESSYSQTLVSRLKADIPADSRSWDHANKRWLVTAQYGGVCAKLVEDYLGITIAVPAQSTAPITETRLLRIEYIGRAKSHGNEDDLSAFAYCDGSWSVIFPERVLRAWFSAIPDDPREAPTLFAALGVKKTATPDEIKSAYRRMARLTHPDVNHEPNAAEQFKAIQRAWDILSNDVARKKYIAGLKFAAQAREAERIAQARDRKALYEDHMYDYDGNLVGYQSPIRCGWILMLGQMNLARFVASNILEWQDITSPDGKILVTSWPKGADMFMSQWV